MSCSPIIAARLVTWRLLDLSDAVVLSDIIILISEDFRAVLRRDNLLLLFRQDRSLVVGCHRCSLDVAHL